MTVARLKFPPEQTGAIAAQKQLSAEQYESADETMKKPLSLNSIHKALGWHQHPRNGKVARLPEPVRQLINEMLDGGSIYRAIIQKLKELGIPGISEMNLSNWYRGGYQDYRFKQLALDAGFPADLDPAAFGVIRSYSEVIGATKA